MRLLREAAYPAPPPPAVSCETKSAGDRQFSIVMATPSISLVNVGCYPNFNGKDLVFLYT